MEGVYEGSRLYQVIVLRDAKIEEARKVAGIFRERKKQREEIWEALELVSLDADPKEVAELQVLEAALTHLIDKITVEGYRLGKEKKAAIDRACSLEAEVGKVRRSIEETEVAIKGLEGEIQALSEQSDGADSYRRAISGRQARLSELRSRREDLQRQLVELTGQDVGQ